MKKVYLVQRKHITVGLAEETEMAGIGATLDAAKGLAATQVLKWFRVDAPLEWESRTVLGGIKEWTSLCKIGRTLSVRFSSLQMSVLPGRPTILT